MTYERFCEEYNCKLEDAQELVRLAKKHKRYEERSLNGESFGLLTDKAECSGFWNECANEVLDKMKKLAYQMGFIGMDFTELYPTLLRRGNERWINLPE